MAAKSHVALAIIGALSVVDLILILKSRRNSADEERNRTPYVAGQNDQWPNGKMTLVGTRAVTCPYPIGPKIQGGRSVVTSSTGRFAQ